MAIGVGDEVNVDELMDVASEPHEYNIYTVSNYSALTLDVGNRLINAVCNNDDYCASNPCMNGAECLPLSGGFTCNPCPLNVTGDLCQFECNGTIDLAFVLHSAGTVHPERWHYVTQFVVDVIEQLDVGLNRTRVAVITWSDSAHVAFTLDRFAARQDVTQAVRRLPYLDGRTNTTAALNLLREAVFQTSAGDRPFAPNVALLVANGESTLDGDRVSTEAAAVRDAGIVMVVVAADHTVADSVELKSIVSPPP